MDEYSLVTFKRLTILEPKEHWLLNRVSLSRQCLLEIAWICIYDPHESGARTLPLCWLKKTATTKHTLGTVESCVESQVADMFLQSIFCPVFMLRF